MARRKTKAERDQQMIEADRLVWEKFYPKLRDLQSFHEAVQLLEEAPPESSPGLRYYSNLGFFLQAFTVPAGSNYTEKGLYLQFIQMLDAAGALKPGAREKIEKSLRDAMESQSPWCHH